MATKKQKKATEDLRHKTPDQLRDFIKQEIERYRDIIVRANIQAQ